MRRAALIVAGVLVAAGLAVVWFGALEVARAEMARERRRQW